MLFWEVVAVYSENHVNVRADRKWSYRCDLNGLFKELNVVYVVYLWVSYDSQNKQGLYVTGPYNGDAVWGVNFIYFMLCWLVSCFKGL
jgi:hypothetical protein